MKILPRVPKWVLKNTGGVFSKIHIEYRVTGKVIVCVVEHMLAWGEEDFSRESITRRTRELHKRYGESFYTDSLHSDYLKQADKIARETYPEYFEVILDPKPVTNVIQINH